MRSYFQHFSLIFALMLGLSACGESSYVDEEGNEYVPTKGKSKVLSNERAVKDENEDPGLSFFEDNLDSEIVDNCLSCHGDALGSLEEMSTEDSYINRDELLIFIQSTNDECDTTDLFDFVTSKKDHEGYKAGRKLDEDMFIDWLAEEVDYCP